jgi:hypothetical protein
VDRSTVCRLCHSATVTLGARSTSRTCLSGFSDRRLDRNGLPGGFGGRGGNRTLICWLQASGPPIERLPQTWLRAGELNATRMAYEASTRGSIRNPDLRVTNAVLFHLSYSGASRTIERVRRIELRFSDRRSDAQPIGHTRTNFGADGDNRNLFSGLEAQGTPYIPRPFIYQFRDAIQLSKTSIEAHLYCIASE